MKRILYDMGHLTVAKWLLQRALKFNIPLAEKGLLLQRLSKIPRGCGSSNSRLRAANSHILAATVKPPLNFGIKTRTPLN